MTVSESHRRNHRTGNFDGGGPFYTSRVNYFINDSHIENAYYTAAGEWYSGPVWAPFPTTAELTAAGFTNLNKDYGAENTASLSALGTTAISQSAPINPASNLGTTLAEMHREGLPSLPGIQLWKRRTEAAKAAAGEYLNYEFGWAPLVSEVHNVTAAARSSRDIMKQYRKGEGRNTRRRFDFPSQRSESSYLTTGKAAFGGTSQYYSFDPNPERRISLVKETKRWFEGCFTYALPSSTDSWRKGIAIGSQADQVFGLALTPDVLWELTPWSWAVDWFSNAGDVINNVTNFGLAGLVLRYGYMMEESIETVTAEVGKTGFFTSNKPGFEVHSTFSSPCSSGFEIRTKRRVPASPFGFSIGWEGLSPTQLAITAALGISKLL